MSVADAARQGVTDEADHSHDSEKKAGLQNAAGRVRADAAIAYFRR